MKGIVYEAPGVGAYKEDLALPRIEKPTDAVCKITSSALCGSDLQ